MHDGYTFVRHRVATGEQTAAYFRGALTPNPVSTPTVPNWPVSSNNGQDYLILDPKQGFMDVTYSSAWQLGKTMAIADFGFAGALMRFRNALHSQGVKAAAFARLTMVQNTSTKADTLTSLNKTLAAVGKASSIPPPASQARSAPINSPPNLPDRFTGPDSNTHPDIKEAFVAGVADAAKARTAALGDSPNGAFDEVTNKPGNNDWNIVLSGIGDRLWLSGIPSHYLVPDASFLPPECIRFFNIDRVWMDCFIDGALSVANHLARETDPVRQEIKQRISEALGNVIGINELAHHPQVPTFGFFLRSAVVSAFPDLVIEVPYTTDKTNNASAQGGKLPILVRKQFSKDIIMCLLDRTPTGGEIASIKISQPVHQQCFSVGDFLNADRAEFMFRKVYRSMSDTDAATEFLHEMGIPQTWLSNPPDGTVPPPSIYNWDSRCLQMDVLNNALFEKDAPNGLPVQLPAEWGPSVAKGLNTTFTLDSSMTGLQLNDTVVYLEMVRPEGISEVIAPSIPNTTSIQSIGGPEVQPVTIDTRTISVGPNTKKLVASLIQDRRAATETPASTDKTVVTPSLQTKPLLVKNITAASTPSSIQPLPSSNLSHLKPVTSPPDWQRNLSNIPNPPTTSPVQVQPQFAINIFPSTVKYMATRPSFAAIDTPYDCDLIFSINLRSTTVKTTLSQTDLYLSMLTLQIPIGDEQERIVKPRLLKPGPGLIPDHTYSPLSARMLSNQRWVVHIDPVPPYLILRLLPRTTNRTIPIMQNPSLSFKLNGVALAGANGDNMVGGVVQIQVREYYVKPGQSGTVKDGVLQGSPTQAVLVNRVVGWPNNPDPGTGVVKLN